MEDSVKLMVSQAVSDVMKQADVLMGTTRAHVELRAITVRVVRNTRTGKRCAMGKASFGLAVYTSVDEVAMPTKN